MTKDRLAEIKANLERSEESIHAAEKLQDEGFYDSVASRAYYAAFYAAAALLLSQNLEFGKHSAVIAAIHQKFVKTGKLDQRFGKDLNWLFELRGVGDYGELLHVFKEDASEAIKKAKEFLEAVKMLIEHSS